MFCLGRDSDRGTVEQHRSLAHGRSVVSLLHAVHRCDVCAFAAGTKRHVQVNCVYDVQVNIVCMTYRLILCV
jgi:hypothetical protein